MNFINKMLVSKRIAIFGWPATGKSTFGNYLSNKINISLYSLDEIRWKYSHDGIKDDNKFLEDYNEILKKDKWIIEGNALDFIDSRLKYADILVFFDSTISECIDKFNKREEKVKSGIEKRLNFDEAKKNEEFIKWIRDRYSKKIEKLRPILSLYKDKLIVINSYDDLNDIVNKIDLLYEKK